MKYSNICSRVNTCLAVDLGGTKILVGEVDENGKVVRSRTYNSVVYDQNIALDGIISSINDYLEWAWDKETNITSIGIGVVGRVDKESGMWFEIDPSKSNNMNVAEIISEKYKLPCAIDNDVRCAATAEKKLGWGKSSQNYIYINIGTGIAACFVVDGEIIRGSSFNAGEIGHQVVNYDSDIECDCGRRGCLEAIASGKGMDLRARKLKKKYSDSPLLIPEDKRCSIQEIFNLSDNGDPLCKLITEDAIESISCTIMNLVRVSDPETIILGGGVVSDGWLLPKLKEKLDSKTMRFVKNGVVLTELDPHYIGLIGAATIGHEHYLKLMGNL